MNGQVIIDEMLRKAQEAQDAGNKERAEHWLKRAEETEIKLKAMEAKQ